MSRDDLPRDEGETTPFAPRSIHEEDTQFAGQFGYTQQPPAPPGQPTWPGPPPGAGYQQQPPPSRAGLLAGPRRWWVIGGAVAVVTAVVVALVVFTGGDNSSSSEATATTSTRVPASPRTATPTRRPSTPAPAPPPPPVVDAAALPGLLLPAELINQRMNTTGMTADPPFAKLLAGTVTPPQCAGAWGPAYEATYQGSGYTGLAIQGFFQPPIQMVQAVVSFPDAGSAKAFYDKQVADWNACKSTHIRYESGGVTEADLGVPSVTVGVMTMMLIPTTAKTAGQQCERDMTVRSNVIVDVRACSPTVGSAGLSIAREIADKIAPAP
ncbi:sensor domain-containing protein [Mycobacterium sp. NPDC051804]|uniref:sensor domain-containing protein n=1 Tax=Mycobacterium sp. NPDC051804 TaxID=3364295 RepID=UPI00378A08A3